MAATIAQRTEYALATAGATSISLSDRFIDFILIGNIEDLTNYKDDNIITCRIYQEAK